MVDITKNFLAALRSLFKSRFELQAEIVVLRHQLTVLRRRARSRPHLRNWGSATARVALPPLPVRNRRGRDHCARHFDPVASKRLPGLLAVEVAIERWPSEDSRGSPQADPRDEPSEPTVGCAANPWRAAQARHRGRRVDSGEVHDQAPSTAGAELEDISAQPC